MWDRSESLTAESRLVHASPNYRLIKSRSESDLSQPESDEEGYALVGILIYLYLYTLYSVKRDFCFQGVDTYNFGDSK